MAPVDKRFQTVRVTVAACRAVVACRLISPRAVKGVLGQRQQLNVGVAHFLDVRNKQVSHFLVSVKALCLGLSLFYAPAAEMHLVNVQRLFVVLVPCAQPRVVAPRIAVHIKQYRRVFRTHLVIECERVGAVMLFKRPGGHNILIDVALPCALVETAPHSPVVTVHIEYRTVEHKLDVHSVGRIGHELRAAVAQMRSHALIRVIAQPAEEPVDAVFYNAHFFTSLVFLRLHRSMTMSTASISTPAADIIIPSFCSGAVKVIFISW